MKQSLETADIGDARQDAEVWFHINCLGVAENHISDRHDIAQIPSDRQSLSAVPVPLGWSARPGAVEAFVEKEGQPMIYHSCRAAASASISSAPYSGAPKGPNRPLLDATPIRLGALLLQGRQLPVCQHVVI
jgi:hypothetical protein